MYREYFALISADHQRKLLQIIHERGISIEAAMRNIVVYIESQNVSLKHYFAGLITVQQIEKTIDMLLI